MWFHVVPRFLGQKYKQKKGCRCFKKSHELVVAVNDPAPASFEQSAGAVVPALKHANAEVHDVNKFPALPATPTISHHQDIYPLKRA